MPAPETSNPLEELLEHRDFLRSLAQSLVGESHAADDLVQQTWLAALRKPPRHDSSLRGWLAQIVRSLAASRFLSERQRCDREEQSHEPGRVLTPSEIVEAHGMRESLFDALQSLEDRYREVIYLRHYEDLPASRIAERLDLPVETVRTRLKRGLAILRGRLDRSHGDRSAWGSALVCLVEQSRSPGGIRSAPEGALPVGAAPQLLTLAAQLALVAAPIAAIAWYALGDGEEEGASVVQLSSEGEPEHLALALDDNATGREELAPAPEAGVVELDSDAPASLRVHIVSAVGERPFIDLACLLEPGEGLIEETAREIRTDAAGEIRVVGCEPGAWKLTPAIGPARVLQLEPGEETEVVLRVPEGREVLGRVVNSRGNGVRNAELWLSYPERPELQRHIGSSAADGSFQLTDVDPRSWLGARDRRRQPSDLVSMVQTPDEEPLVLRLTPSFWQITGIVSGPLGEQVAGASIRTVDLGDMLRSRTDLSGRSYRFASLGEALTDSEGAFELRGLPAREFDVVVTADGYAPLRQRARAVGQKKPVLEKFVLQSGSPLSGRVLSAGAPVAGAIVHAVFQRGIAPRHARTDESGRYSLEHMPLGYVHLYAEMAQHGWARTDLELQAGTDHEWDAHLDRSSEITGVVLDTTGAPLVGWDVVVEATPIELRFDHGADRLGLRRARTDEEGHFSIGGCGPVAHMVRVSPAGESADWSHAVQPYVQPGAGPVELWVGSASIPSARLSGELRDALGGIPDGGSVVIDSVLVSRPEALQMDAKTGRFESGLLPPGEYAIGVRAPGVPPRESRRVVLLPGDSLDVGILKLEERGSLIATLKPDPDKPDAVTSALLFDGKLFRVRTRSSWYGHGLEFKDGVLSASLYPGEYLLQMSRAGGGARRDFVIEAGRETAFEVDFERGLLRTFEIHSPSQGGRNLQLDVISRAASGVERNRKTENLPAFGRSVFTLPFFFPPGESTLELRIGGEVVHTLPLHIEAVEDTTPIVVKLGR